MNAQISQKETLLYRTLLALALIVLAAALRIAPHPWNFTPVGAMALFAGALIRDRRLAFLFPLLALFAGDLFVGFHKLMFVVYASFLVNVAIGLWLRDRRTIARISLATLLGAISSSSSPISPSGNSSAASRTPPPASSPAISPASRSSGTL